MQVPEVLGRWLGARDVSDLGISTNAIRQSAAAHTHSVVRMFIQRPMSSTTLAAAIAILPRPAVVPARPIAPKAASLTRSLHDCAWPSAASCVEKAPLDHISLIMVQKR